MKRTAAALVVLAALAQQSTAQQIVLPPIPPTPAYCDPNALVRAARAVIGNEVIAAEAAPTPLPYRRGAVAKPGSQTGIDCYTFPTCAARLAAQDAQQAALEAVARLRALDELRAQTLACETTGYGR